MVCTKRTLHNIMKSDSFALFTSYQPDVVYTEPKSASKNYKRAWNVAKLVVKKYEWVLRMDE